MSEVQYDYDEVCGYFESGKHDQGIHDSWESLKKANPGRFDDHDFPQKVHRLLEEKGAARVYFVAVECGGKPGIREARKMQRFLSGLFAGAQLGLSTVDLEKFPRVVRVCTYNEETAPAVRVTVREPGPFMALWKGLQKIPNSSCGCSIMVSDSQEIDVRVMDTDHISYGEKPW